MKRWDPSVPFNRVRMVCWFCCVTKGKQLKIKYFNLATQQNKHVLRTGTSVSLTISFLGQSMMIMGRASIKNEKTQNWVRLLFSQPGAMQGHCAGSRNSRSSCIYWSRYLHIFWWTQNLDWKKSVVSYGVRRTKLMFSREDDGGVRVPVFAAWAQKRA